MINCREIRILPLLSALIIRPSGFRKANAHRGSVKSKRDMAQCLPQNNQRDMAGVVFLLFTNYSCALIYDTHSPNTQNSIFLSKSLPYMYK